MHLQVYCQNIKNHRFQGRSSDLEVYYGIADSFVNMVPIFYNYLSDYEKARADRFKHESDYNCYISIHALLRIELSKLLRTKAKSIRIEESENGKPFTSGVDLPFSLSRTKNIFAFVIGQSNQLFGIDIEQIKPGIDFTNISREYFSIKEQQLIFSFDRIADQNRTFFEIWTRKEALLKAIGTGINTELCKVQVLEGENHIDIEGVQINANSFKIATIMNKRALISIASSIDFAPRFKDLSL
jgi:4'-phosphopantetheinyl transferase